MSNLSREEKDRALFDLFALLLAKDFEVEKSTRLVDAQRESGMVDVQRRDNSSAIS